MSFVCLKCERGFEEKPVSHGTFDIYIRKGTQEWFGHPEPVFQPCTGPFGEGPEEKIEVSASEKKI